MPALGKRWRFVTISTRNSWKPGDERGWRSRDHRIHSSGDYKHRPPPDEHEGLREWMTNHSDEALVIPRSLRSVIGQHLITALRELGHAVTAISVSGMHSHILVELPDEYATIRAIIGEAKRAASRAVKAEMPGSIWAEGGDFEPVDSKRHAALAANYILTKQGPSAWIWSFRQASPGVELKVKLKVRLQRRKKRTP